MGGFYIQYLESLCRRRGWTDPSYECYRDSNGYTCLVLVNGCEYQTDLAYESDMLAQENAAMRAFMVCHNFSEQWHARPQRNCLGIARLCQRGPSSREPPRLVPGCS